MPPPPSPPLSNFSPPSPPTPISLLPPPLSEQHPPLLAHILTYLHSCQGLDPADRLVLASVLQHAPLPLPPPHLPPSSQSPIIDRILALPVPDLKLLARLFTIALYDARSWGERRSLSNYEAVASTTSSVSGSPSIGPAGSPEQALDVYSSVFETLGISPFPVPTNAVVLQQDNGGEAGQVDPVRNPHEVTAVSPESTNRRKARQTEQCLKRQTRCCPITWKKLSLKHAHLIPHSITSATDKSAPFWILMTICLGPQLRDQLYSILSDDSSYSTINSLVLDSTVHTYYHTGRLHLVPLLPPGETFDPTTCRQYDLQFRWRSNLQELSTCCTIVPSDPGCQVVSQRGSLLYRYGSCPVRPIDDGDLFRLFTNNPGLCPLPHPLLFQIRNMLWDMVESSGMAGTAKNLKRRWVDAVGEFGDNDLDGGAGRRRVKGRSVEKSKPVEGSSVAPPGDHGKASTSADPPTGHSEGITGDRDLDAASTRNQGIGLPAYCQNASSLTTSSSTILQASLTEDYLDQTNCSAASADSTAKGNLHTSKPVNTNPEPPARGAGEPSWLAKEYLAFKLRQHAASVGTARRFSTSSYSSSTPFYSSEDEDSSSDDSEDH